MNITTTATLLPDENDHQCRCQACASLTYGLVQVSLGDVWLGNFALCDDCRDTALAT